MHPIDRSMMILNMHFHHQGTGEIVIFGQDDRVFSFIRKMRFHDSTVNPHESLVIKFGIQRHKFRILWDRLVFLKGLEFGIKFSLLSLLYPVQTSESNVLIR